MTQDRLRSNLHDASCDRWTLLRSTIVLHYTLACVLLTPCCAGQNQVTGPSQTILVTAGDDVVLPCYLGPTVDASGKTVEWTKQDLEPRFVLVWRDGAELQNQKNPDYKGRTSLLIDKLTYGDVSLKVSRVRISDRGKYRCFTPSLGKESTVELVVGAVSFITINLKKNNTVSGAVELDCESKGWYPEPEVLWLDSEGNLLSAGPTETLRAPDDLYTVSSRLTVEKRHGNSFTCRVQQTRINQTRLTHIQLSAELFADASCSSASVGLIVVSLLGSVCAAAFIVWKRRQNQTRETKLQHQSAETEQLLAENKENREQVINALMEQENQLQNLNHQLKHEMTEMEKICGNIEEKVQSVEKETDSDRVKRYLELKGIMLETKHQLRQRKAKHQQLVYDTRTLVTKTQTVIQGIKVGKKETKNNKEETSEDVKETEETC
ncbi:butyrophilin subfamily 3 member A2-like [Mastacembelus armatus]|uniref:butyrophilin subfamily 3 member A2-like n=1 Tax=Mastacembelus armatus TaxID=205130 RepID=UPI001436ADCB|nr:butyrophilin subfamily 3 member A2-like [Mastacembelus armatus]